MARKKKSERKENSQIRQQPLSSGSFLTEQQEKKSLQKGSFLTEHQEKKSLQKETFSEKKEKKIEKEVEKKQQQKKNLQRTYTRTFGHNIQKLEDIKPEEIPVILDACDRSKAGPTAPAKGLTMIGIEYEEDVRV